MPLPTTCIGAYPKPGFVPISDWFQVDMAAPDYEDRVMAGWSRAGEAGAKALLDRATRAAVADQIACGVDLPTDGEIRRENYVHYQCRHMDGFDFATLTRREMRNGAYNVGLPTITGPVRARGDSPLVEDWRFAESAAGRPVKITLPGPMTVADTTADAHYGDPARLAADLAEALNAEVRRLAAAGCRNIQIDEPIFARKPAEALAYGVDALTRCFHGVPEGVNRVMHMCCGYPGRLDDAGYPKADPDSYVQVARAVDGVVDQISVEDAHRYNPPEMFALFERSALIVGFVAIAASRVETVEEIRARMLAVRGMLPAGRLIAAPDCGLGFLGRDLAMAKLRNLCAAARSV